MILTPRQVLTILWGQLSAEKQIEYKTIEEFHSRLLEFIDNFSTTSTTEYLPLHHKYTRSRASVSKSPNPIFIKIVLGLDLTEIVSTVSSDTPGTLQTFCEGVMSLFGYTRYSVQVDQDNYSQYLRLVVHHLERNDEFQKRLARSEAVRNRTLVAKTRKERQAQELINKNEVAVLKPYLDACALSGLVPNEDIIQNLKAQAQQKVEKK